MSDQIPPIGAPLYPPPPEVPPASPPSSVYSAYASPSPYQPAPPPPEPRVIVTQRRGPGALGTILIAAVVAAVVGGFAGLAGYMIGHGVDDAAAPAAVVPVSLPQQTGGGVVQRAPGSIAGIADATLPAVVSIIAEGDTAAGSGSGFVIRADGYILTNNHVVELASGGGKLTVVFPDGTRYKATVIGTNTSYDTAVIKVDAKGLPTVPLGDSAKVRVGDAVVAIGAPFGLDGTVTSGIVSALDRPVSAGGQTAGDASFINAIQTDAAINPGNSGGPLLDASGAVVGINTAISSTALGVNGEAVNIGLGFAVPINSAKRVAEELIATGKSRTPLMGVKLDMTYTDPGAKVQSVTSGSPSAEAGLRSGDIITKVNGRGIDDATELVVEIRNHVPGEKITVGYTRDGKDENATLILGDDSTTQ